MSENALYAFVMCLQVTFILVDVLRDWNPRTIRIGPNSQHLHLLLCVLLSADLPPGSKVPSGGSTAPAVLDSGRNDLRSTTVVTLAR